MQKGRGLEQHDTAGGDGRSTELGWVQCASCQVLLADSWVCPFFLGTPLPQNVELFLSSNHASGVPEPKTATHMGYLNKQKREANNWS